MKLFEIDKAIQQVLDRDDLDPTVMKDTLDSLNLTREDKMDGLAGAVEGTTADLEFITNKIRKLTDQKRYLENRKNNLQAYMTEVMDDAGFKKLHTKHYILRTRNYRAKTVITNDMKIPKQYKKEKTTTTVNRKALYKDLKDGKQVDGAHLEPNRKTLIN